MAERPTPGEPLKPGHTLSASWLNHLLSLAKKALITVDASSGMEMSQGASGTAVRVSVERGFWLKLTASGGGGVYAWTMMDEAAAGTWVATTVTGTTTVDPAYELNLNASISLSPNPIVRAWRAPQTGEVRFMASVC